MASCPACKGDGRKPDKTGGGHHGVCPFCGGSGEKKPAGPCCPECGGAKVRYRSTKKSYICDRCGYEWARPIVVDENQMGLL